MDQLPPRQRRRWLPIVLLALLLAVGQLLPSGPFASLTTPAHAATNGTITLRVTNARSETDHPVPAYLQANATEAVTKDAPIRAGTHYTWLVNADNVGDPTQSSGPCRRSSNPNYPQGCNWPAIREVPGASPVVAQGDENNLNTALSVSLPNGKYLLSVMADGYKIDGSHFTVNSNNQVVTVAAQPFPLPLATVLIQVVEDRAMTNGEYDIPDEDGTFQHSMGGFKGHLNDVFAEVTTDWFGNPLCTTYNPDGSVLHVGAGCLSDSNGLITIPNMGPNRYTATVVPPDGTAWVQTSTLEGNHDWDTWVQEGATGLDTERITNGEPVPALNFTFVCPTNPLPAAGPAPVRFGSGCATRSIPAAPAQSATKGSIKGRVWSNRVYVPPTGGLPYPSSGYAGAKLDKPIADAWLALTDVNQGDQLVFMGKANTDGTFTIANVPNGDYTLTVWDNDQEYLLDLFNVTVANNQIVDLHDVQLAGWWTWITGTVFIDSNGNGKQDPGEQGVPNLALTLRTRSNDVIPRGSNTATTDASGYYEFREAYPTGFWLVEEMYNDRFFTTGITFQADNQPTETTLQGLGVDVNVLPIIGLGGRIDWGIKPYVGGTNGGIVGTVTYDATRNETKASESASETYQPGIPNVTLNLYQPIPCVAGSPNCVANPNGGAGYYGTDPATGALLKGPKLNTYQSDTWVRPQNCIARDVNGAAIDYALLPNDKVHSQCLESPMQGFQVGTFPQADTSVDFTATVDGNYAFNFGCFGTGGANDADTCADGGNPTALPAADYIVEAVSPTGYEPTKEEDVNVFNGDQFVPQITPPACVGALHTVNVVDTPADAHFDLANPTTTQGVYNPGFLKVGGSPFQGQQMALCDSKLIKLSNGRSAAWNFNLFTPTPMPGRLFGLVTDDLNLSFNPQDLLFGEKAGVPNVPIGIYDYTDRLITTIQSDPDGFYEVLLPSTSTYNCPLPAGPCPNVYRLVANDPGQPSHPNANYTPAFRTISASFEVWPGQVIPADHAPTQIGVTIQGPGSLLGQPAQCLVDQAAPQLFAVDKPNGPAGTPITIKGQGFGTTQGSVTLDNTTLPITSWGDHQIQATIAGPFGPHQLTIKAANGQKTVDALTYQVTGGTLINGYNPTVREVGPGKAYASIQAGIEAARNDAQGLVVVYPGATGQFNPDGSYNENIIIHSAIKLQGVGPGGVYPDNTNVLGSVIDGTGFGTDAPRETAWFNLLNSFTWTGNQNVYDGQVVYVLQQTGKSFNNTNFKAAIDGFTIQGGDQLDFPGNITEIFGIKIPGGAAAVATQGGGIYVNGGANNLQITNNVLKSNGGSYGGAIRLGTPSLTAPLPNPLSSQNVRIANNRIIDNGGTNRAGGVGIFAGTTGYEIANNDLCGNFSAEYGGAISQYGLSGGSAIHDNRIYFNRSYDEGAGIMIAGEMPLDPNANYGTTNGVQGAGAVDIYNNQIQANLANDDGGGIRFLQAGNFVYNVYNNMIVNNISTHEGGALALDDAPNVRLFNNTIMKNITTATASTSNGAAAPAGLSTGTNSVQLQNTLRGGTAGCGTSTNAACYSNPLLFNNIFSDNRAGSWNGNTVTGIGMAGDATANVLWDMGSVDAGIRLNPTNSLIDSSTNNGNSINASPTNLVGQNPAVIDGSYNTSVSVLPWRGNPTFVGSAIVAVDLPPNLLGNYHLQTSSPAVNAGAVNKSYTQPSGATTATIVNAPAFDIDRDVRTPPIDAGADELHTATADLSITKTHTTPASTSVAAGGAVSYRVVASNAGPDPVTGATVADSLPANLTGVTWTCSASTGSSCPASGSGSINVPVNLLSGGSATFILNGTVAANATGSVVNSATVAAPTGITDPAGNNSASDTLVIALPLPTLTLLDNFNRANANTLNNGTNWSQGVTAAASGIRVNGNQASCSGLLCLLLNQAIWNNPTAGFGTQQGAAFTFANTTLNNVALILKATGTNANLPANFIRVSYNNNQVVVETTTTSGLTYTARGTLAGSFANGDTLTAVANADGSVDAWKTSGATTTYLGHVTGTTFTGSGRIGIQLPNNARVDDFKGGNPGPAAPAVVVQAFTTAVLDTFALQSGPVGSNWRGATTSFAAQNGQAQVTNSGAMFWTKAFGTNQEARFTFSTVAASATSQGLLLKVKGLKSNQIGPKTSMISVRYDATTSGVLVETLAPTQGTILQATFGGVSFTAGDTFSAQALVDGTVKVYKNGQLLGSTNVVTSATPMLAKYAQTDGKIGVLFNAPNAAFDDFGGGTLR